jgi:hypothetical protein
MRVISASLALAMFCLPFFAMAQQKPPKPTPHAAPDAGGPKAIGHFDAWTAATNVEAGQHICYAFTRAQSSSPAVPGRGDVVLTVAQRPGGRDAVAISAGFAYPANASVQVQVDQTNLDFYIAQRSAFARDGHTAVAAFQKAPTLVVRSPAPKAGNVSDTFSLRGFNGAYAAISKACPAK